ncbi:MAG: phosphoribosylformylglycinamidine synthase subunit PurS [Verrucomicrobiota bacterium]
MKATIIVTPKKSVLDPQGEAVKNAIHQQGMECVTHARIGRIIELEISGTDAALTRQKLEKICKDVLSNPVIEDFHLELQ